MGKMVLEIIKDVLDAYTERDLDKALAAWHRDEEVDDLYTSLFRETLTYMMEDPRNITPCTHLLFTAKNIRAHRRPRHQHRGDHPLPDRGPADHRCPAKGRFDQFRGRAACRRGGCRGEGQGMSEARSRILVVEDEADLVTLLSYNLEREGFDVLVASDGDEALLIAEEESPDLILLDWMLPHRSGLEVCRQLRRRPQSRQVPIIMLTARGDETDRVRGLDTGADDYVAKPFSMSELIARVRAVMRRAGPATAPDELLRYADVEMDLAAHRVRRSGDEIHLGPTEFRLLRHFLEHPQRVFSRERLLDAVWGRDVYVEPRTVDVHTPPPAQGAQRRLPRRSDPHRALRRLRPGRRTGVRRGHRIRGSALALPSSPFDRLRMRALWEGPHPNHPHPEPVEG